MQTSSPGRPSLQVRVIRCAVHPVACAARFRGQRSSGSGTGGGNGAADAVFADAAVDDPIVAGADAGDVLAALPDVSPTWLQSEAIKESRREYLTSGVRNGATDDDVHGKRLCRAVNTVPLPTLPTRCWVLHDFISQHLSMQTALVDWAASLQHCPWQATPRSHRCFKHGSSPCVASRSCWRQRFARPVPARTSSLTPLHLLLKASAVC
jgi:hypothetical protein